MPVLKNAKWERFAQELAKGRPAGEAYISAGYSKNDGNASRLKGNEKVLARVGEILAARETIHSTGAERAIEKVAITKEWVLSRLVENANRALQAIAAKEGKTIGEYKYEGSVANRALELLGKELGMFIDRKETGAPGEFADLDNPGSLEEAIARRLGLAGSSDAPAGVSKGAGSGGKQSGRVH